MKHFSHSFRSSYQVFLFFLTNLTLSGPIISHSQADPTPRRFDNSALGSSYMFVKIRWGPFLVVFRKMLSLARLLTVLSLLDLSGHTILARHEHNIKSWASTLNKKTFSAQSQPWHNSPRGMVDDSPELPVLPNYPRP